KEKRKCTDEKKNDVMKKIRQRLGNRVTSTIDGIRVDIKNRGWFLVRPSGTEPLIRIYVEGKTENDLKQLLDEFKPLFDETVASSNRLPRFLIGACSTLVGFETEQSAGFFLEDRDGEGSYVLSIPFLDSPFVSREPSGMDISRLVTALVTVNSNNKEE